MATRSSLLLALVLSGCGAAATEARNPPSRGVVTDNLTRDSYAGSAACAGCHPAIHQAWLGSPMRSMTRLAKDVPVEPVFDGRVFAFKDDRVTLLSVDGVRYMRVERGGADTSLHRVTKVIGGRYREDFVGALLDGLDPAAPPSKTADERVLPVSYLLGSGALRYKGYSVLVPERPYLGRGTVWRRTCIGCHNTLPHLTMLYDDLFEAASAPSSDAAAPGLTGAAAPAAAAHRRLGYFGNVGDHLLPPERRVEVHITSPERLREALSAEAAVVGGPLPASGDLRSALTETVRAGKRGFGEQHLVEVGIGCEACHGGSREHARRPSQKPAYQPVSPFLSVTGRGGRPLSRAEQINRVCARCHTVLFTGYRPTWEGGVRPVRGEDREDVEDEASSGEGRPESRPPGGSAINSGEARDFLLGGCASEMACTDCHDPHASDGFGDRQSSLGKVCEKCHSQYGTPAAIAAHTHHRADGPGSACLNCHMPRKNMGLGYRLTRYHRIGSPSDPDRVLFDRPLECALCHDQKTVAEIVDTMSSWWGKSYDRAALVALYGPDLGQNALFAALSAGKPHERAAAAAALAERGRRDAAARMLPVLSDQLPLVRYFAADALSTLVGAPFPWDVGEGDADRPTRAAAWLAAH